MEAISQWILGIRPTFNGLQLSPVVPDGWKSFKVFRKFRGNQFNILFNRIGKGNDVKVLIDGITLESNVIPLPNSTGNIIDVYVELGILEKNQMVYQNDFIENSEKKPQELG